MALTSAAMVPVTEMAVTLTITVTDISCGL